MPEYPDDETYKYQFLNDILLGKATSTVRQGPFRHTLNPRHRFEFCQKIVDSFWKTCMVERCPPSSCSTLDGSGTKISGMLRLTTTSLLLIPTRSEESWTTGRIVQVFPGEDEGNMIGIDCLNVLLAVARLMTSMQNTIQLTVFLPTAMLSFIQDSVIFTFFICLLKGSCVVFESG